MLFCTCDRSLDSKIVVYKYDLDIPTRDRQIGRSLLKARWQNTIVTNGGVKLSAKNVVSARQKINIPGQGIQNLKPEQDTQTLIFAPVTLTLTRWSWYMNLTWSFSWHTCIPKMTRLGQPRCSKVRALQTETLDHETLPRRTCKW